MFVCVTLVAVGAAFVCVETSAQWRYQHSARNVIRNGFQYREAQRLLMSQETQSAEAGKCKLFGVLRLVWSAFG
jgi:putative N-acetylmannosamine-6-phosphate epimerase